MNQIPAELLSYLTEEEKEAVKACEKATPGPWTAHHYPDGNCSCETPDPVYGGGPDPHCEYHAGSKTISTIIDGGLQVVDAGYTKPENAKFCATARTILPAVLRSLAETRKQNSEDGQRTSTVMYKLWCALKGVSEGTRREPDNLLELAAALRQRATGYEHALQWIRDRFRHTCDDQETCAACSAQSALSDPVSLLVEHDRELLEPYRWIPVTEGLPQLENFVHVIINGIVQMMPAAFTGEDWEWLDESDHAPKDAVTHWIELPTAQRLLGGQGKEEVKGGK